MSVRALRHDKRCGRFSKSRGLSASVSFLSSPPPPRLLAPFFARSLHGNSTETLATQASTCLKNLAHVMCWRRLRQSEFKLNLTSTSLLRILSEMRALVYVINYFKDAVSNLIHHTFSLIGSLLLFITFEGEFNPFWIYISKPFLGLAISSLVPGWAVPCAYKRKNKVAYNLK